MAYAGTLKPQVQFIKNGADFARDLYLAITKDAPSSFVISPFFIYHCFGALYMGAADKTADEMGCCLEFPCSNRIEVAKFFQYVFDKISQNVSLRPANKLFVADDLKIKVPFRKACKTYFHTEEALLNFERTQKATDIINNFVMCRTENKICEIIYEDMVDKDTMLVVVCAVYFKGLWKTPFRRDKTCKRPFWISEQQNRLVDMMHHEGPIKCNPRCEKLEASIIELEYDGPGDFSLMVLLPFERNGLKKLEKKFRKTNLLCISNNLERVGTVVDLPKFSLEFFSDMKFPFEELGMESVFQGDADFSNMCDNDEAICVSKVVHKAFIEVDEEGTKNSNPNGCCNHMPQCMEFEFKADHPFIFVIKSKLSILFIGRFLG